MSLADGTGLKGLYLFQGGVGHSPLLPYLFSQRTMTGAEVFTNETRPIQRIDPGGSARNIDLPVAEHGLWFLIFNAADAAETITVRLTGAGATVGSVAQNKAGFFWSDGTSWYCMLFTITIS